MFDTAGASWYNSNRWHFYCPRLHLDVSQNVGAALVWASFVIGTGWQYRGGGQHTFCFAGRPSCVGMTGPSQPWVASRGRSTAGFDTRPAEIMAAAGSWSQRISEPCFSTTLHRIPMTTETCSLQESVLSFDSVSQRSSSRCLGRCAAEHLLCMTWDAPVCTVSVFPQMACSDRSVLSITKPYYYYYY